MCTAIISFEPAAAVPVLLVGVRDELLGRPWTGPGRHWPDRPGIIGGRDLLAGGTWLAVAPDVPRVACVVNGFGPAAPEAGRLSRGVLPLLAAGGGELDDVDLSRLDPFHLVVAEPTSVRLHSWNGSDLRTRSLKPGLHIVVNTGLDGQDGPEGNEFPPPRAAEDMASRLAHFRPRLLAAGRPSPGWNETSSGEGSARAFADDGGRAYANSGGRHFGPGADLGPGAGLGAGASGDTAAAWSSWLPLIDGDGLDLDDPRAMILRRDIGAGQLWGTSSVSLVALRADGVRYDFADRSQTGHSGGTGDWRQILG